MISEWQDLMISSEVGIPWDFSMSKENNMENHVLAWMSRDIFLVPSFGHKPLIHVIWLSTLLWFWWSGICLENVVCSRTWVGLSCSSCRRMHHWILWCDMGCAMAFETPDRMHWPTAKQVIRAETQWLLVPLKQRLEVKGAWVIKTRQWIQLGSFEHPWSFL